LDNKPDSQGCHTLLCCFCDHRAACKKQPHQQTKSDPFKHRTRDIDNLWVEIGKHCPLDQHGEQAEWNDRFIEPCVDRQTMIQTLKDHQVPDKTQRKRDRHIGEPASIECCGEHRISQSGEYHRSIHCSCDSPMSAMPCYPIHSCVTSVLRGWL